MLLISIQCIASLQQSPWLFPFDNLELQEELGSGAFGVVRKAQAQSFQAGEPATIVAVKMLKGEHNNVTGCGDVGKSNILQIASKI